MPKKTGDGGKEAASTLEAKPTPATPVVEGSVATESVRDIERVLDEVFLTPRVVDQRTFDELAAGLKALVREAAEQARALSEASRDMQRMDESLRAATKELHGKLESAVGVLPSLDQRVERAEGVLEEAKGTLQERLREMKAISGDDFRIDRERIVERVKGEVSGAIAAIVEQELRGAKAAIESATGRCIARVQHAMGELDTASREGEVRIVEMGNERVEDARARMTGVADDVIAAARAAIGETQARLGEMVESGRMQMTAEAERVLGGLRDAAASAEEFGVRARREAASATAEASGKVSLLIEQADETLLQHKAVAETLNDLTGSLKGDIDAVRASLDAMVEQARSRIEEAAEESVARVSAERGAAASAASADKLVPLVERAEASLAQHRGVCRQLEELARATREQLDALQAKAEAKGPDGRDQAGALAALSPQALQQAQQIGAWLAHLVGQADLMGRGLDRLIREGGKR